MNNHTENHIDKKVAERIAELLRFEEARLPAPDKKAFFSVLQKESKDATLIPSPFTISKRFSYGLALGVLGVLLIIILPFRSTSSPATAYADSIVKNEIASATLEESTAYTDENDTNQITLASQEIAGLEPDYENY